MSTKERPILMSGAMVRACLAGTKTQTRRVMKKIPCQCSDFEPEEAPKVSPEGWQLEGHSGRWWCRCCTSNEDIVTCPYGKPGDRLWVRESFCLRSEEHRDVRGVPQAFYMADPRDADSEAIRREYIRLGHDYRWKPSIHMPRWASRIELEIVSVRVERLHSITLGDICCEGLANSIYDFKPAAEGLKAWEDLWTSINGPDSWAQNPWVWVVEFKRVLPA